MGNREPSERHSQSAAQSSTDPRVPQERHEDAASQWPDENPFPIITRIGFRTFWVSREDESRYMRRRWRKVFWGDPNYETNGLSMLPLQPDTKGMPVVSKDLTLYEMSEADAINLENTDPARTRHRIALNDGKNKLEEAHFAAVAGGAPHGEAPITSTTITL
jgi:hypothetical protein